MNLFAEAQSLRLATNILIGKILIALMFFLS